MNESVNRVSEKNKAAIAHAVIRHAGEIAKFVNVNFQKMILRFESFVP